MVTREKRKERITEQRKQQILDAAFTVFSRKGFGESTIPDIAQEAGIAVGTIYNYYESKRDLLVSVVTDYVIAGPFLKLFERSTEADDRAFLSSVIENRLNIALDNIDGFFLILSEIQRDPELRRKFAQEVLWPVLKLPESYLESRVVSGIYRSPNIDTTVRALVGMVIGFITLYRLEGEGSPCYGIPRSELAAQLADFVLCGLRGCRNSI